MKLRLLSALLLAGSCVAGVIPRDSSVYVSEDNEWLGEVRAELIRLKVPVRVILFPEKADFVLRGSHQGNSAWIELITADGEIVWAERINKITGFKGPSRTLAGRLKKAILKR